MVVWGGLDVWLREGMGTFVVLVCRKIQLHQRNGGFTFA